MQAHDDIDADGPVGPAAERLRRKLVRLLFVSGGIMMLGLIAVFAAIVYKVGEAREPLGAGLSAASPVDADIAVPAGRRLVATEFDGDRALLTVEGPAGATSLLLVDLGSGAIIGRYELSPE
jgi:hypothetical protein